MMVYLERLFQESERERREQEALQSQQAAQVAAGESRVQQRLCELLSLSLSLLHTHTQTHTHTHTLSLSLTHTHTHTYRPESDCRGTRWRGDAGASLWT